MGRVETGCALGYRGMLKRYRLNLTEASASGWRAADRDGGRSVLPRVGCGYPCTRLGYYTKPALVGGLFFADSCKLVVRNAQSAGLASPTISAPFPLWFLSPCCTNGRCKKTAPTQGGELRPPCLEAMPCRERPGTTLIVSLQVAGAIKFCFTVPSPCCAGPFFFSPLVVPTHGSTHKLHPALRECPSVLSLSAS